MRRKEFRFPVSTLAGSSLCNIFRLISGYRIHPRYYFKFSLTLLVSGILGIFSLFEKMIWGKRIREFRLQHPPVFIIGFWRSGTTHLHNLLCQDPGTAYTTTYQTVFPNLVFTGSFWLKRLINFFLPSRRPYDNVSMDVDFPQEEDFGLMNLQSNSIYKFFLFPRDFERILDEELFTGSLPEKKALRWEKAYREMIAKAVFNTGGDRYIGKNPCHLTRIPVLRKMFPEARFIFIHRHPYQVIESLYHFILSIFPGTQLQDVPETFNRETVVKMYVRIMDAFFEDVKNIPSDHIINLKMNDFQKDVHFHLEKIYSGFDLGDYNKVRNLMDTFIEKNPRPPHEPTPPDPRTYQLVEKYAGHIMMQLGYAERVSI